MENDLNLIDNLRLQAQCNAQEARTANSTINEIYQVVSGAKGEPGNWNGARPVRDKIAELEAENARLVSELETAKRALEDAKDIIQLAEECSRHSEFQTEKSLNQDCLDWIAQAALKSE